MATLPSWVRRYLRANEKALRRLGMDPTRTYGCGGNGCAFPTRGGRWTVKVTADPSEVGIVRSIEALRARGVSLRGVVRVRKVGVGRDQFAGPRVWVIVRETFRALPRPCPSGLRRDVAQLEAAAALAAGRNDEAAAGRPTTALEHAFREELARARGPGREVAATMLSMARRGVYLEDVRWDNLGLVRRGTRWKLAITDPGGNLEYPSFSSVPRLRSNPTGRRRNPTDPAALAKLTLARRWVGRREGGGGRGRTLRIMAYGPNRRYVGGATFIVYPDHLEADVVFVNAEWQRKGVATLLYDEAARRMRRPVRPSTGKQSDGAVAFWEARNRRVNPRIRGREGTAEWRARSQRLYEARFVRSARLGKFGGGRRKTRAELAAEQRAHEATLCPCAWSPCPHRGTHYMETVREHRTPGALGFTRPR